MKTTKFFDVSVKLKTMIALCLILPYTQGINAQGDQAFTGTYNTNDLHQIWQIEGTNNKIKEFFRESDLFFTYDTVYIILIPPMKCSRCEGVINPFIYEMNIADPETPIMIMAFYPKKDALHYYLRQRKFMVDHTMALTDFSFLEFFHFSTDEMQVPYLTKFNITEGEMIAGKSTLGVTMDKEFVAWFRACKHPAAYHVATDTLHHHQLSVPEIKADNMQVPLLIPSKEMVLGEEEGYPLSRVVFPSFNNELSYFAFMDELSFRIYLYYISPEGMIFEEGITPGPTEERRNIDPAINDTLLKVLKRMNIINTMYFNSLFLKDTLIITSSLPYMFYEDSTYEKLAYYNLSTYLYRTIDNDSVLRYLVPDRLPDSNLTLEHLNSQFIDNGRLLCVPVSKGWPVSGTEMLDQVDIEDNPFLDTFYDKAPLFAIYDHHGHFIQYFGELSDIYSKRKLGYSYCRPLIRGNAGMIYYADKYAGCILGYNGLRGRKPSVRINIFDFPDYQSPIDAGKKPLAYIKDYKYLLTQSILDFQVYQDTVYVVTSHEDFFYYKKYTAKGKLLSVKLLPTVYDHMDARHFVFSVNDSHQQLIGVYESIDLTSLLFFD